MFKLNFKIALRNLKKYPVATCINIGGIAVAIAAFIVIVLYTRYENNFDANNPNYENIYLVGRDLPNNITSYTSAELAKKIKETCPEIVYVGKTKFTNFEFAMLNENTRLYLKNVLSADADAYKIFNFRINIEQFKPKAMGERSFFLSLNDYKSLFPKSKEVVPEMVMVVNKAFGMTSLVDGVFTPTPHSNIVFDGLALADDISFGTDATDQSYTTFIQVKPDTDIDHLENKINLLYHELLKKNVVEANLAGKKTKVIFLDPLKNLHLQARTEAVNHKKIIDGVLYLGFLVLLLGCFNAININIEQSTKRAKEIGVKKVMGATRYSLSLQFMLEIFVQCSLAVVIALIIVESILPSINTVLSVNLSLGSGDPTILWLLPITLLLTTILTGIYPAWILSSFKPALVLKGNFEKSFEGQWLKKVFLVFQFSIAMAFIIGLLIVKGQLNYMQTQDKGFSAEQLLYIKNQAIFNKEEVFKPVKDKIQKIDGVKSVTVASNIPTSPKASSQLFSVDGIENHFSVVNVGFDYFETLDIKLKDGRLFSSEFGLDTVSNVIINEAAVKKYNISNPIGKAIRGCNTTYNIIGVISDFKSEGFEKAVEPTLYSIKNACGEAKLAIMVKIDQNKIPSVLRELKGKWAGINKLDGEDLRYEFVDNLYNKLFERQERLRFIISALSAITMLIALFGIFAYAKFMTNSRRKEIAVRRILGAGDLQIVFLLNSHFTWLIIISNVIAVTAVYIIANKWLENFAYKQSLSASPFVITSALTGLLIIFTVSYQAYKAMKTSPAVILKSE
ncbi:putative ABC transport system permease protein [Pedobacter sp. CAN_A7]|uniref:ABC transporter permease n=1 Tax=Pedobacter sp. CAN_A7 TaxID=2787722 RepID=UPI0018C99FB2